MKGVGRVYQQTFLDTYAKVGFAKLYDRKTPITAADLLNDRVLPFYEENGVVLQRVLTDRGTEYCGTHDRHEYELYLAVENIDHTPDQIVDVGIDRKLTYRVCARQSSQNESEEDDTLGVTGAKRRRERDKRPEEDEESSDDFNNDCRPSEERSA
jgi:hypothetical protein